MQRPIRRAIAGTLFVAFLVGPAAHPKALGLIECTYTDAPDPPVPVFVNESEQTVSYDLNRYKLKKMDIVRNDDQKLHARSNGQIFILNKNTMEMVYAKAEIDDSGKRHGRFVKGSCEG